MSDGLSVGIIMDGNRRWAHARNLPTHKGHEEGAARVRDIVEASLEKGISCLYLYAFSTENWNRTKEEVGGLMRLLEQAFAERIADIEELGVRICVLGERERFSNTMQDLIDEAEERSKHNSALTVAFCLSYGGRREIAHAMNTLLASSGSTSVSEDDIRAALWGADLPDPDLIIRPGGEKRLSNFLLWQGAYAELFFTDTLWPDFTKEEYSGILEEFVTRSRRKGT